MTTFTQCFQAKTYVPFLDQGLATRPTSGR